jgi:hypothetical protein
LAAWGVSEDWELSPPGLEMERIPKKRRSNTGRMIALLDMMIANPISATQNKSGKMNPYAMSASFVWVIALARSIPKAMVLYKVRMLAGNAWVDLHEAETKDAADAYLVCPRH